MCSDTDLRHIHAFAQAALAGEKGVLKITMPSGRVYGFPVGRPSPG